MTLPHQRERLKWRKKPFSELLRLAWPITVSMLSYSVMTVVDTLFVGRLGASALAAVGLGGTLCFTVLCFGFGFMRGQKVLVAQAAGAGAQAQVKRYVGASLYVALGLGAAAGIAGQLLTFVIPALSSSALSAELARDYVGVRSLSAPLVLVACALREARYALGDSKGPMRAAVLANVANVPLNATFILWGGFGVAGAAWATVLAQTIETLHLLVVQRRYGFGLTACRRADIRLLWSFGALLGLERLLDAGAFSVMVVLLSRLSEVDVAAHHVGVQLLHFSLLPALAIGEAVCVLSGQALGAREDKLFWRIAFSGLWLSTAYAAVCSLSFVFFGNELVSLFTPVLAVRAEAERLLLVAVGIVLAFPAYIVSIGVLRGVGDVRFVSFVTVVAAWACTPSLALVLGYGFGLGVLGGWIGLGVEILSASCILGIRFVRGGWRRAAEESHLRLLDGAATDPAFVDSSV